MKPTIVTVIVTLEHDDNHPGSQATTTPELDEIATQLVHDIEGQITAIFLFNEDGDEHRYNVTDVSATGVTE